MLPIGAKLAGKLALVWGVLAIGMAQALPVMGQSDGPEVIIIEADGPVIPPMRSYIERGIREAEKRDAEALLIVLNTPGGSVTVTQAIVQSMRASRVPIIVYVGPRGAFAASAGTIITLAGHAAAMAPQTTIGAASPVGGQGQDLPDTLASKTEEILSAQARGLAEPRGEKAVALADAAVNEAKAVTASEALEANFVDLIADDVDELLDQIDGLEVALGDRRVVLRTAFASQRLLQRNLLERILTVLVDPTLVFILLSLGSTAIIIEIGSPGGWVAGAIGVSSLGLSLYGLGVLPINWLGFIFIVMAFVLFLLDIKAPTHGALTAGGLLSMIAGGIVLFQTPDSEAFGGLSIPVVILESLWIAAIFAFIIRKALNAQSVPATTGAEGMLGMTGKVVAALGPQAQGTVLVASERWRAVSEGEALPEGSLVEVTGIENFTLHVRPTALPPVENASDNDNELEAPHTHQTDTL